MTTSIDFELVRILLAAGMLGIASFLDIRGREVSDLLWVLFVIMALVVHRNGMWSDDLIYPAISGSTTLTISQ